MPKLLPLCTSLLTITLAAFPTAAVAGAPARTADGRVSLIVEVGGPPVTRYAGGVPGLAATRRAAGRAKLDARTDGVEAYRRHLASEHAAFESSLRAAIPHARVVHRYDMVVGGVAVLVPEAAMGQVASLPGVRAVYEDRPSQVHTNKSPAFIGAKKLWGQLGGPTSAGEGVIIGVLDTGVWPEHPSFADPDPYGNAYPSPPGTYGCEFSIGANPGAPFTCNNKLIGAYRFLDTFDKFSAAPPQAFTSVRDDAGHGTHTASTAAGNGKVKALVAGRKMGSLWGVAPRAHVIAYRTCGFNGACYSSDVAAAVNQAIVDGVDVINYSVGGGRAPYVDPVSLAFLDAYDAGILVAASAGNDGPGPDTLDHLEPWVLSVGASTDKGGFAGKANIVGSSGEKLKLIGASISPGLKPAAEIVLASSLGDEYCNLSTPDDAFAGKVVACRAWFLGEQSYNVGARGGIGMIAYNDPLDPPGTHPASLFVPGMHVDGELGQALVSFLGSFAPATALLTGGKNAPLDKDLVATFSSRGGPRNAVGVLKPDLVAPGVQVLAGATPAAVDVDYGPAGELFQSLDGTSMSSPHAAGAAALVAQARPGWTPGRIRSALMTSSRTSKVFKEDGVTPADNFDVGAGRIDLKRVTDPGLTFDATAQDFRDHADAVWETNLPSVLLPANAPDVENVSRTAKSELSEDSTWTITVDAPSDLIVSVPAQISVPAGGTQSFSIGLDKSALGPGEVRHASITLEYGRYDVRLPVSAVGAAPLPDLSVTAATATSPATPGDIVFVSATVSNSAAVGAGPFSTWLYLSGDSTLSSDDSLLAACFVLSWPASTVGVLCDEGLVFDPTPPVAPGTYQLVVVVDPRGQVSESDETNNVLHAGSVEVLAAP